jgi:hypothetical protein
MVAYSVISEGRGRDSDLRAPSPASRLTPQGSFALVGADLTIAPAAWHFWFLDAAVMIAQPL